MHMSSSSHLCLYTSAWKCGAIRSWWNRQSFWNWRKRSTANPCSGLQRSTLLICYSRRCGGCWAKVWDTQRYNVTRARHHIDGNLMVLLHRCCYRLMPKILFFQTQSLSMHANGGCWCTLMYLLRNKVHICEWYHKVAHILITERTARISKNARLDFGGHWTSPSFSNVGEGGEGVSSPNSNHHPLCLSAQAIKPYIL